MSKNQSEFMRLALERFRYAKSADEHDRKPAVDDIKFIYPGNDGLGQWDQDSIDQRRAAKRPIVTFNRLGMFAQTIANQSRAQKTSIEVSPADGGNPADAEYMQMRIRQIEYESRARIAYDTATDSQINCGRGFVLVRTDYVPGTFRQRAVIERIEKQFSVFMDPDTKEYDCSDARFAFVISNITVDEHRQQYGRKTKLSSYSYFTDGQNPIPEGLNDWVNAAKKLVQIADYYVRECTYRTLCETFDGLTFYKDEVPPEQMQQVMAQVREEREEEAYKVTRYTIDGCEVLDEQPWIGTTIPVVPFWGKELIDADGKKVHISLIRPAKAPQKLLNHATSGLVEMLSIAPKNVWVGAEGQFDTQTNWAALHQMATAYAEYKLEDVNGKPVPPPQLMSHEPAIQAQLAAMATATDGIKAALGIFDASIGAESNEKSGVAIARRQQQTDAANYHFQDNAIRSIERVGRILVEIIPQIDAGRTEVDGRTLEDKPKRLKIGQPTINSEGKEVTYQPEGINPASLSVVVSAGPSFKSEAEEANQAEGELIQAMPELMYVIGDQYFRHRGKPGDLEKAKRMEKVINMRSPGLIETQDEEKPAVPPEVEAQVQQMQQENQQLTATVEGLAEENEQLKSKQAVEMERLAIEREQLAFEQKKWADELAFKYAQLAAKEDETALKTQVARISEEEAREERREAAERESERETEAEEQPA